MAEEQSVFTGREAELEHLEYHLQEALQGRSKVVFLAGEAGIGKTALVEQFRRVVQSRYPRVCWLSASCDEVTGSGSAYAPFKDLMAALVSQDAELLIAEQVAPTSRWNNAKERTLAFLREVGPAWLGVIPIAGSLLSALGTSAVFLVETREKEREQREVGKRSHDSGSAQRDDLFRQAVITFKSIAERYNPLLLFVDDWHWSDASSTDLLFHMARQMGASPILVLATYRPDEAQAANAGQGHPILRVRDALQRYKLCADIELAFLSPGEITRYLAARFGQRQPDVRLATWLAQVTNGNALFLTEYVSLLVQEGVLTAAGQVVGSLDGIAASASVEAVVQARIRQLDQEARRILEYASADGESFTTVVLSRLLNMEIIPLNQRLRLVKNVHQLIFSLGSQTVYQRRTAVYRFVHKLIHDTLYQHLEEEEQEELNRTLLRCKEEFYAEADEATRIQMLPQLVMHAGRACEFLAQARYALDAAQTAAKRHAHPEVLEHCRLGMEALDKLPPTPETRALRVDLLLRRGRTEDWTGGLPVAQFTLAEAENLAQGDPARLARIYCRMGYSIYYDDLHDHARPAGYFRQAQEILEKLGDQADQRDLAETYNGLGVVADDSGEALQWYERALAVWENMGPAGEGELPIVYHNIGRVYEDRGDYDQAMEWYEKARATDERILGDEACAVDSGEPQELRPKLGLGTTYASIARIHYEKHEYGAARRAIETSIDIQKRTGSPSHLTGTYIQAGQIAYAGDDREQAERWFDQAVENERALHDEAGAAEAQNQVGVAYYQLASYEPARARFERARAILEPLHDCKLLPTVYRNLASAYQELGEHGPTLEWLHKARELFESLGRQAELAQVCNDIGLAMFEQGEFAQAREWFHRFRAIVEEMSPSPDLATAYHNLGHASLNLRDLHPAVEWLQKSMALQQALDMSKIRHLTHLRLGDAYAALGAYDTALEHYSQALSIEEQAGLAGEAAHTCFEIGLLFREQQSLPQTLYWWQRAQGFLETSGDLPNLALTQFDIGSIYEEQGDDAQALEWHRRALATREREGLPAEIAVMHMIVGRVCRNMQSYEESLAHCTAAVQLDPTLADAYSLRSDVYRSLGRREEAIADLRWYLQLEGDPPLRAQGEQRLRDLLTS